MAKLVRMQPNKTDINADLSIVKESGAMDLILSTKGDVTIKSSRLHKHHPLTVYDRLVSLVDRKGLDGKKEVKTDYKHEIYVSGKAGGAIASYPTV